MMIRAYQEIYLSKAQSVIGEAFDYAVNTYEISGEDFAKLFCMSTASKRIQNGEPNYVSGKSGIEIVREIIRETKGEEITIEPQEHFGRSREYWIGWAVAYYQWYSGRRFGEIFNVFSFEDLQQMYYTLHEADITKFVEIVDLRIKNYYPETNLKRKREVCGYTQKELAGRSGVTIRSIQMYEQRNKDINKASVETVYRLAKALGCQIEELIEK